MHLKEQQKFYNLKRKAKVNAQKSRSKEAIAIDFCKNFPCPNIKANDVYYKRQLSDYMVNITVLSTETAIFMFIMKP